MGTFEVDQKLSKTQHWNQSAFIELNEWSLISKFMIILAKLFLSSFTLIINELVKWDLKCSEDEHDFWNQRKVDSVWMEIKFDV